MQNESELSALTLDSEFFVMGPTQSRELLNVIIRETIQAATFLEEHQNEYTTQDLGKYLQEALLSYIAALGKTPAEGNALVLDFSTGMQTAFTEFFQKQERAKMH